MARLPPTLQLRLLAANGADAVWRGVVRPSPRRWWHLVFNPAGTETLAAQTLVERWYTELVELGEASSACETSRRLVTAFAERALERDRVVPSAEHDGWQLRLIVTDDDDGFMEVVYESDRMDLPAVRGTS